ncbi:MAG TPA: hypothetical protein VF231_10045, partial [Candidatus Limnocylindrales bacterium]
MTGSRRPGIARARLAGLFLVLFAAGAVAPFVPAGEPAARAATPNLTLTSETRYDVDPEAKVVHVSVALTATNRLTDTKTREYYFDRAFLAVQPGTTNFKISARSGSPSVTVQSAKADHTLLRIDFGRRLPAGSNRTFQLTFDIPDPGGAPTRETRIGASLVSFGAWAFASEETSGGSVTVVFPPGFDVDAQSEGLGEPTVDADGRTIFTSGKLSAPLEFFAYFVADRPAAYVQSTRAIDVGGREVELVLRAWPDDPGWAERVGGLLERGLPVLADEIGLAWPADPRLIVEEATSRSAIGFSGRYDPEAGRIEIAYYADSLVILHEAAHAWFDGSLLAERWATEGFASYYATRAAAVLEEAIAPPVLTPELIASEFPLNAWSAANGADPTVDDYGYAASAELARLIAERAGPEALEAGWESARAGRAAYPPSGLVTAPGEAANRTPIGAGSDNVAAEAGAPPPDWRGILDLLEDRTGRDFGDLWRTWVVRHEDASLLDERSAARRQYDAVNERAGEWRLPPIVREAMRAWQFDQGLALLAAADRALEDRDRVQIAVAGAGLTMPASLEAAFEGDGGFSAGAARADAHLQAVESYKLAAAAQPADPNLFQQVGLWGLTPAVYLEDAEAAFGLGAMAESVQASSAARVAWTQAEEVGRNRVISIIAATLAALIAVWIVVSTLRAARRSARRLASRAGRVGRARRAGAVPGPHLATAGRSRPLTQAHRPDS